jgi:hypothetical protein
VVCDGSRKSSVLIGLVLAAKRFQEIAPPYTRAYVFEPSSGAHQLTVDDIRSGGDAMTNLREDSVVSNAMSADTDFAVHHHRVQLSAPFLVAAATDGCFGYLPTPMHFEYLVLTALRDSSDTDGWSSAVQTAIARPSVVKEDGGSSHRDFGCGCWDCGLRLL